MARGRRNRGFHISGRTLRSIRSFFMHLLRLIRDNELGLLATSMAFATVLSVMPLIAVSLSVFLFIEPLEPYLQQLEALMLRYLLSGPGNALLEDLRETISQMRSSVVGSAGLVFLLVVATKLLRDVDTAVQRVWGERRHPRTIRSFLSYLGILILGPLALAGLVAALSMPVIPYLGRIPTRVIAYLVVLTILYPVYQFVPRQRVRVRAAFFSAVGSVALLALVQGGYGWITANVLNYNRVYGSLAVLPLFLIWILLFWIVFLLGNAFCATLTHRMERSREQESSPQPPAISRRFRRRK